MAQNDASLIRPYLTIRDLCTILQISRSSAVRFIAQGQIRAFKVGNMWRISEDDLRDFCRRNLPEGMVHVERIVGRQSQTDERFHTLGRGDAGE